MKFNVEMSIRQNRTIKEELGYRRDEAMELKDILAWVKEKLIVLSLMVFVEEVEKGFDENAILLVDEKRKPLREVSPLGKVEFIKSFTSSKDFADVIKMAYRGVERRSKVYTGKYLHSHRIAYRGVQVAEDWPTLHAWLKTMPEFSPGDKIRLVNTQPYGRKLELLGVTSSRTKKRHVDKGRRKNVKTGTMVKVPNGAYALTARKLIASYKHNLDIKFSFISGGTVGLSGKFKKGKTGSVGRPYLYPCITFTILDKGIRDNVVKRG